LDEHVRRSRRAGGERVRGPRHGRPPRSA
jgi:hypothetical protein